MIRHAPWADGPADFAIALRPAPVEDWFEGGEDAAAIGKRKGALLTAVPELVWGETPGSSAGQAEALALVEGWAGRAAPVEGPALWRAGLLVADDLCLMERVDGAWTLTALSLCAGSLFNAAEVVGRQLEALHAPVPGVCRAAAGASDAHFRPSGAGHRADTAQLDSARLRRLASAARRAGSGALSQHPAGARRGGAAPPCRAAEPATTSGDRWPAVQHPRVARAP
jgi:hypothetical protein